MLFANIDGGTTAFGVALVVTVEYDVVFSQFSEQAPSRTAPRRVRTSFAGSRPIIKN